MTQSVRQLLDRFEHLSEAEQVEAAKVILHRTIDQRMEPLTDEQLMSAADELFSELDADEADDANRNQG